MTSDTAAGERCAAWTIDGTCALELVDGTCPEHGTLIAATHPRPEPVATDAPRTAAAVAPAPGRSATAAWTVAAISTLLAIGMLVTFLLTLRSQDRRFDELQSAVESLDAQLGTVGDRIDGLAGEVAAAGATASPAAPAAPSTTGVPGGLPQFQSTENDPAVINGMVLGEVSGTDYYTGDELTYLPSDGKARVWMVWAHWCPYCQAELPEVSDWYAVNATQFPNTELVSVTTSIDPSRGNPLEPYLDESQFGFPVLVDRDYRLASQFGTSAFPYWVVTGPDGRVVVRVAGAIGVEAVENIFTQLEAQAGGA